MVGIHAFPKAPFSGVTEDDLHNARERCEKLLFNCCTSHLTFHNLLERAERGDDLDDVAAQWVATIERIHKSWPPFRYNNVGSVIAAANVGYDARTRVTMGSTRLTFPTAHAAIERTGQWVLSTMNRNGYEGATKESLASPTGRKHLREGLADYPQIGNELFESLKSALVKEWGTALAWVAENQPVGKYDPVNAERDRWLYEQWHTQKKTWAIVLSEFKKCRANKGWQAVDLNGIRTAVKRYAKANNLPLRVGRGGRPKDPK